MSASRLFIYGSCVSRDALEFFPQGSWELVGYVPRQSLIAAARPASGYRIDLSRLRSRFQRRITQGTISGSLFPSLRAATDVDLVLWDLTDERTGVFEFANGAYLTRTVELDGAGLTTQIARDALRHVPFGSDEHFALWQVAALQFRDTLGQAGLIDKTVVIAPPWAATDTHGRPTPASYGVPAEQANQAYERYLQFAEQILGSPRLTASPVYGDVAHKWGLAPFHYDDETYRTLARGIRSRLASSGPPAAPPTNQQTRAVAPAPPPQVAQPAQHEQPSAVVDLEPVPSKRSTDSDDVREVSTVGTLRVVSEARYVNSALPTVVVVETLTANDVRDKPWVRTDLDLDGHANLLFVNDPTLLVDDPPVIGWGLGDERTSGVDALLALINDVDGDDGSMRVYLGSGAGGFIALQLAIRENARHAVLSNPDLGWHDRQSPSTRAIVSRVFPSGEPDPSRIDVRAHAQTPGRPRPSITALVNTAHPQQWEGQLKVIGDLTEEGSAIDVRSSRVLTYHDEKRKLAPATLEEMARVTLEALSAGVRQ